MYILFVLCSNNLFSLVSDEESNREEQSVAQTGSLDDETSVPGPTGQFQLSL